MSGILGYFLTYLPAPVRFYSNISFQFHYVVSDFGKPTYLPTQKSDGICGRPLMPLSCRNIFLYEMEKMAKKLRLSNNQAKFLGKNKQR